VILRVPTLQVTCVYDGSYYDSQSERAHFADFGFWPRFAEGVYEERLRDCYTSHGVGPDHIEWLDGAAWKALRWWE